MGQPGVESVAPPGPPGRPRGNAAPAAPGPPCACTLALITPPNLVGLAGLPTPPVLGPPYRRPAQVVPHHALRHPKRSGNLHVRLPRSLQYLQCHDLLLAELLRHRSALRLKLDGHGFEVNDRGQHVPVSYMGHGYCNQTYVPELNKLMLIHTHSPWWGRALPQRRDWLDASDDAVKRRYYGHAGPVIENPKHPLFYEVREGRWDRTFVAGEGPGPRRFEGVLEYLPSARQAFFLEHGRVWFYDFAKNRWLAAGAERVSIEYDSWGCYDSRRDRVYVARREAFWAYDVKADRWSAVRGQGQPADLGSCVHGAITYDVELCCIVLY